MVTSSVEWKYSSKDSSLKRPKWNHVVSWTYYNQKTSNITSKSGGKEVRISGYKHILTMLKGIAEFKIEI